MNIAVLISGNGTNLQALIDSVQSNCISAQIRIVVSNRSNAYGLFRAQQNGIPTKILLSEDFSNQKVYDDALLDVLDAYKVELVVLAGFLSILSERIVNAYRGRIINVHPSLIPSFSGKGFYGDKVHRAVLAYGVKLSGATVHFVDEGTDTGPIILQEAVEVNDYDDLNSLKEKVLVIEHRLLVKAVKLYSQNRIVILGRRVKIIND